MRNLMGLGALAEVGELWVRDNDGLLNLSGLGVNNPTTVEPEVHIINNSSLVSLAGLEGIGVLTSLRLLNNDSLATTAGLGATGVRTDVRFEGPFQTIDLSDLAFADADLLIVDCPQLISVSMPALTSVGRDLNLYDAPLLQQVELDQLTQVGGYVSFRELDALASIDLPALQSAGFILVGSPQPAMSSFSAPSLDTVSDSIDLGSSLDVVNLASLITVGGDLEVEAPDLTLGPIQSVGGDLTLSGAPNIIFPALTSAGRVFIRGSGTLRVEAPLLPSTARLEIEGDDLTHVLLPSFQSTGLGPLEVRGDNIQAVDLSSLTSTGRLDIRVGSATPDLTSLQTVGHQFDLIAGGDLSFPSLQSVAQGLYARDSLATSLSLPALVTVGWLTIARNDLLTTLDLGLLNTVAGSLSISTNVSLPQCLALNLANAVPNVGGNVLVLGNDDPCVPNPCGGMTCVQDCMQPLGYVCM